MNTRITFVYFLATCLGAAACESGAAPEPTTKPPPSNPQGAPPTPSRAEAPRPKIQPLSAGLPGDPLSGKFTLEQATEGLPGAGSPMATLDTDKGRLDCELWPDKAPITVANFVGLARGLRPWKTPRGTWEKKPLYDGTTFHRIIKGFMIQGGDPMKNGMGDPGYTIPDEIWDGAKHDERGMLCMANRGPDTNGAQFFILDGAAAHLDGKYTIFGKCRPTSVIDALASVRTQGDRPLDPPAIKKVTISRRK